MNLDYEESISFQKSNKKPEVRMSDKAEIWFDLVHMVIKNVVKVMVK